MNVEGKTMFKPGALNGITVIDLSRLLPGPYCSMILADHGARVIEKADVLLEGFRPGVVDRLGADYESVRKVNPKIIYCSITGYGQDGPFRDRVGHDVNYLSFSGVLNLIGEPDRPPSIPGIQIADVAAGGMNAAIGILLALFAREKPAGVNTSTSP